MNREAAYQNVPFLDKLSKTPAMLASLKLTIPGSMHKVVFALIQKFKYALDTLFLPLRN